MQARYHPVLRTGSTLDSATIIYRYLPCCCVLQVRPVNSGTATLKDATSEAIRDLVTNIETTHYILGSAAGPHPYPAMVREFQSVIGKEVRQQCMDKWGGKPDVLVACIGGGSNAIGLFHDFVEDEDVRLIGACPILLHYVSLCTHVTLLTRCNGSSTVSCCCTRQRCNHIDIFSLELFVALVGVEAAGYGVDTPQHAATLTKGSPGVLHGSMSYLIQDADGQIVDPHSISAGLDYPGVLASPPPRRHQQVSDFRFVPTAEHLQCVCMP